MRHRCEIHKLQSVWISIMWFCNLPDSLILLDFLYIHTKFHAVIIKVKTKKNEDISWYVRHKCTIVSTLWRRFDLLENLMCASGFFFGCHIHISPFARRTIYVNLSIMSPFAMTSLDYLKEETENERNKKKHKRSIPCICSVMHMFSFNEKS